MKPQSKELCMTASGATVWFIPDAYLPEPIVADGPYVGHEAICDAERHQP